MNAAEASSVTHAETEYVIEDPTPTPEAVGWESKQEECDSEINPAQAVLPGLGMLCLLAALILHLIDQGAPHRRSIKLHELNVVRNV